MLMPKIGGRPSGLSHRRRWPPLTVPPALTSVSVLSVGGSPAGAEEPAARSDGFTALESDRSGSPGYPRGSLDGQRFRSVSPDRTDAEIWAAAHHGHSVPPDLARGDALPDGVAGHPTRTESTEPGGSLLVDDVSVSQSPAAAGSEETAR